MARAYNIDYSGPKIGTRTGTFGTGRGNGMGGPARDAAAESSRKRTTAVDMSGSGRSPVYPTEVNKGMGGKKDNGIGKVTAPKTRSAGATAKGATGMSGDKPSPMGGLPGKGGPNRSAGVPRVKHHIKSEGF